MVRCMLFDARLGQQFWGYAALTAVHIINRLPGSTHKNRTPFRIRFAVPPSIIHVWIFGCRGYGQVPVPTRRKHDCRRLKCRFMGYVEVSGSRIYRLHDREAKQVYITQDIVFNEGGRDHIPNRGSDTM